MPESMTEREALRRALCAAETSPRGSDLPGTSAEIEPSDGELLDYLSEEIAAHHEKRIQDHLVRHPETAQRLLDLEALVEATHDPATPPADLAADLATAAGWKDFRQRLDAGPTPVPHTGTWLRIAASLLLVSTLALALQVRRLQRSPTVAETNFPTLELASSQRSAEGLPTVDTAPGQRCRLVLHPTEDCPTYRADLRGPGDPILLEELRRDSLGRLDIFLPLPPGDYTLTLSGCDPLRNLENLPFRVRTSPATP